LEEPFTEHNGMVNSTLKIVKHKVYEKYASRIADLYTVEGKNPDSDKNIEVLTKLMR
jgi:long-chain acyl-CoA synthetase